MYYMFVFLLTLTDIKKMVEVVLIIQVLDYEWFVYLSNY